MPEKLVQFTDPVCGAHDGVDRIKWVQFDGAIFPRRGGKGVMLCGMYRNANANSSTLAGFLEEDSVGVANGHPDAITTGQLLPVNFGVQKSHVFPTTGRLAVVGDIGRSFNIWCDALETQHVDMNTTSLGILTIEDILDNGRYVGVMIPTAKRYGAI